MKEKILAIILAAVKNSTFSTRTFDEVAEAMAKTATDTGVTDDKLEAFVTNMLPVFATFQGDVNNQISEAVKNKTPKKKDDPEPNPNPKPDDKKPLTAEDIRAIIQEETRPLGEKIEKFETTNQTSALSQEVKTHLTTHYKISETLCDEVIKRVVITPESTVEDVAKNAVQEYNKLAKGFGLASLEVGIPKADNTPTPPDAKTLDQILDSMN